jgi:GDP-mannose pyrophosphatase NudK
MKNLKNIKHTTLSKEWATLDRIDYDYQFKTGEWKPISRECYNRGDGAAILLYNSDKGTVILTKQFRMPIYENNKSEGMSIEACAGAIDKQVLSAYTSPGALTEKMYLFVAEYNTEMKANEGGGLEIENEEIEVLELPFSQAIEMIKNEEIIDAKTIMLLQYAQINKLLG